MGSVSKSDAGSRSCGSSQHVPACVYAAACSLTTDSVILHQTWGRAACGAGLVLLAILILGVLVVAAACKQGVHARLPVLPFTQCRKRAALYWLIVSFDFPVCRQQRT
jgi:hypothetical protein